MSTKSHILVVDDDKVAADLLAEVLTGEGYRVRTVYQGAEAIRFGESTQFDMVITDLRMPGVGGLDVVKAVKRTSPRTVIIVITAFGSFETAMEAIQNGAHDYISKPFKIEEVLATVQRALAQRRLPPVHPAREGKGEEDVPFESIIGNSPKMLEIYKLVARAAASDATVLIQGESGTGKELIASAIHNYSSRRAKPYVAFNCTALPESLLEAELFGHTKGAFTGAIANKIGLFEAADQGTIFLDEIGDITPSLQTKLLRVLQAYEIRRIGGSENIQVDIRVIAATNKDLSALVQSGQFREDLYYRLHVINITLPPLRDRPEDVPLLANYFLKKYTLRSGKQIEGLSKELMDLLIRHPWPGNIRQLENVIERAVTLTPHTVLSPADVGDDLAEKRTAPLVLTSSTPMTLEEVKKRYILHILDQTGGNQIKAAEILGINRKTLYRLIKSWE